LAAIIGAAVVVSATLELTAAAAKTIGGFAFTWTIIGAFLFNATSLLARWLLTKSRQRIFLIGRFPLVVVVVKLVLLAATAILIVLMIAGLAAGPPYSGISLRALVFGLIASGVLMLVANGLLNTIIVVRQFRGTLATTSRVQ
jgi:hypothetical protein